MITVVIPTYREAENIQLLVPRIEEVLGARKLDYEILIVDDNSPDDIQAVAASLVASGARLRLLQPSGRPRDLSQSVLDGVIAAKHDIVVVMDADGSHPVTKIVELYDCLVADTACFVLGSRYVDDGSFDRQWSLWRFLNSRVATILTRPLVNCKDPMSGFFAFDRTRIEDYSSLKPIGYKIGLELMVRGNFARVKEVAIAFKDREVGESKMNLQQQFNYLRHLRRLYLARFGSIAEFIHFGMVGASGFVVDLIFYLLFQEFGISHQSARALSFWPAVSWNWRLNREATFGERKRRPKTRQWLEFVATSLLGFTINWGVYMLLTSGSTFFDSNRILALLAGVAAASVFNFTLSSLIVYSDKRL